LKSEGKGLFSGVGFKVEGLGLWVQDLRFRC
jgi:hypothetical protein